MICFPLFEVIRKLSFWLATWLPISISSPPPNRDVVTILAGCKHRIRALSELTLIEVQLGQNITVHDKRKYEE